MELKIVKSFKEPGAAFEVCLGPCFVLGSIQFLARVEARTNQHFLGKMPPFSSIQICLPQKYIAQWSK